MIVSLVMPSMFAMYNFIVRSNREISARQSTIQQWYEFFERLNILMQDYTVDYEEYYNRQMVWCVEGWETGAEFKRNIWMEWYCTEFTAYWNENSAWKVNSGYHNVYYCSSAHNLDYYCNGVGSNSPTVPRVFNQSACGKVGNRQSYGQYAALFLDVWSDTDESGMPWKSNCVWDADDKDLWKSLPSINAIVDADHIQELYFISHDWKSRLFFRRKLVNTGNTYAQYKIQMLRLKWFDAWQKHDFSNTTDNPWLYDGAIDTWACDYWMWFEPEDKTGRKNVWWVYTGYYIPANADDCWIDLTHWSTTISARNVVISPTTDSELSWAQQNRQINAYMRILTVNWIYAPYYVGKVSDSIGDFKVPLETTINMKDFYRN